MATAQDRGDGVERPVAVILSASVNADVPARYGEWFKRRLDAGYLRVATADAWRQRKIPLDTEHVDGIVFWTRDITPFVSVLGALRGRGFAFTLQYALSGEPASPEVLAAIEAIRRLAEDYGPRVVVWRYDPVVLDGERNAAQHQQAFESIARALVGVVDEVVIAYARRLPSAPVASRRELLSRFAGSAIEYGMRVSLCADAEALVPRSSPARCIDARRLADVAGRNIEAPAGGFLPDCLCARAIDIGDHGGTAPEQFCGALPLRRRPRHDPHSEFLFEPRAMFSATPRGDLPF